MHSLAIGDMIKLRAIDVSGIKYKDWLSERTPMPGDIARVDAVYEGNPITYQLCCEPKTGFIVWGALIPENYIEYEVIK